MVTGTGKGNKGGDTPEHLRIFISSPGDVPEERQFTRKLIKETLPYNPFVRGKVTLDVVTWDDPQSGTPMLGNLTPQDCVNRFGPRPSECDIVIVIFWARMGTPLTEAFGTNANGEPYLSGTEWEYEDALNASPGPDILVYRRDEEPTIKLKDPDRAEKEEQFDRVERFFADTVRVPSHTRYSDIEKFAKRVKEDLQSLVAERFGGSEAPPATAEIPSEYLEWLRRTCADVSLLGQDVQKGHAVTLNHVYVPALTRPQIRSMDDVPNVDEIPNIDEVGKSLPLLQRLDEESLYVSAAAGAGKSTFCRWAVLRIISDAGEAHPVPAPDKIAEPEPVNLRGRLPLLVPLRNMWETMDCGRGGLTWSRAELELALAGWVDRKHPPALTGGLLKTHLEQGSAFLLLDGLDEVPTSDIQDGATVYPRALILSGLADALPEWHKRGTRVLLTSRPYGLDDAGLHRLGLPSAPLEPLPEPLQALFIERWFHTLDQPELAEGLSQTIGERQEDLAPLAENPMLLTALCVIYGGGRRLPEDRYHLYQRIVDNVLYHRYPGDARQREPVKARLEAIALGMHTGEQESPRQTPAAEVGQSEVDRWLQVFADLNPAYASGRVEPAIQREELLNRSGLLLPRSGNKAAFYHLSFQEHLAAERIARSSYEGQALEQVFRDRWDVPEWRPTLLFLFAAQIFNYRDAQWGLDLLGRLVAEQDRPSVRANPATALFIAETLELCLAKGYRVPPALAKGFERLSLHAIEDEIQLQARHALGLCLGRLGDPRIVDLRDPSVNVEVPAGTYPYGEEGETVEIETPFLIGRYPVTNSQYQAFMDEDGYGTREFWSDAGWDWKKQERFTEPRYWHHRRWNGPNQPVVGVSFWEAEACAHWAGGRLPTEQQWEAAARGSEGLTYPWGDDWEDGICNSNEAGLGMTSAVGLFPRSRQASLGIEDLTGNVWEWCDSFYEESDAGEGPDARRVLRGGSWNYTSWYSRSAVRFRNVAIDRSLDFGFRVARTF